MRTRMQKDVDDLLAGRADALPWALFGAALGLVFVIATIIVVVFWR